jgi:hypothetical protein
LTDGTYNGAGGSFLRGDAAFISLCALLTKLKESDLYLADKLIGEGVFTPAEFETCCIMLSEAIGQEQPEAAPKEPPDIRIETVHYEWDWLAWTWSYDLAIPLDAVEYYKELEREPYSILTGYSSYVSDPLDDEYLKALAQLFLDKSRDDGYGDDDAVQLAISFVQSLAYLPDDDSLDYDYPKYPLETLYDKGGDCEDTSILLVSLIREMGYGCCLIEFEDHMGVGVLGTDNVKGRYFERNGNKYFYVETTGEGWEIGEMPDEYVYETAHIWPF